MTCEDVAKAFNKHGFMGRCDWDASKDGFNVDTADGEWVFARSAGVVIADWLDRKLSPNPEPTLEECLAAINRNRHQGTAGWEITLYGSGCRHSLLADELRIIGKHYIEKERKAKEAQA